MNGQKFKSFSELPEKDPTELVDILWIRGGFDVFLDTKELIEHTFPYAIIEDLSEENGYKLKIVLPYRDYDTWAKFLFDNKWMYVSQFCHEKIGRRDRRFSALFYQLRQQLRLRKMETNGQY